MDGNRAMKKNGQTGKNILCVCSANVNRSVTAAWILNIAHNENYYWSKGSNPIACRIHGGKYVSSEDLDSADQIICMEPRNVREIKNAFGNQYNDKMTCINIPDRFQAFDRQLMIEILSNNQ